MLQSQSTELIATVANDSRVTELIKACGKPTGTIGSEVWEATSQAVITVNGIIANCPDPTA